MKELVQYARSFIGVPYYFGGEHPSRGFDCSGLVQEFLQFAGIDPAGDQSAKALYDHFLANSNSTLPGVGALVFYGPDILSISHVAMMTTPFTVIEAAGGTSEMTGEKALEIAIQKRAFVKERPLNRRKDIVAILMPQYPDWLVNP
jgi:cell wall-associated NlpC family hydrolase